MMNNRPPNWYEMSYDEQRLWERRERQHQEALDQAQRDLELAQEQREYDRRRADDRKRELASERDDLLEENHTLAERLGRAEAFIRSRGLWADYSGERAEEKR